MVNPNFLATLPQAGLGDDTGHGPFTTMKEANAFLQRAKEAGYSDEEAQAYARNLGGYVPSAGLIEDFTRGVQRGGYGAGAALAQLANTVGEKLGFEGVGDETRDRWTEEAASPELAPSVGSYKDIETIGDVVDYAAQLAGSSFPEMAAVGAGALAGGVTGGPPGAIAGGMAVGTPLFAGHNLEAQIEAGEDPNLAKAAAFAVPQALIDTVSFRALRVAKAIGLGEKAAERTAQAAVDALADPISQSLGKAVQRYGKNVGQDVLIEATGEATQQILEIAQADPEAGRIFQNPQTPEEVATRQQWIDEIIESAIGGGVLGGGMAGAVDAPRAARDLTTRKANRPAGVSDVEDAQVIAPQAGLGDDEAAVATATGETTTTAERTRDDMVNELLGLQARKLATDPENVDIIDALQGRIERVQSEIEAFDAARPTQEGGVAGAQVKDATEAGLDAGERGTQTPETESVDRLVGARNALETRMRNLQERKAAAISAGNMSEAKALAAQASEARDRIREINKQIKDTPEYQGGQMPVEEAAQAVTDAADNMPGAADGAADAVAEAKKKAADNNAIIEPPPPEPEAEVAPDNVVPFAPNQTNDAGNQTRRSPEQRAADDEATAPDHTSPVPLEPAPIPMPPEGQKSRLIGKDIKVTNPDGETFTGKVTGVQGSASGNQILAVKDRKTGRVRYVNPGSSAIQPLSPEASAAADEEAAAEREAAAKEAEKQAKKEAKATEDSGAPPTGEPAPTPSPEPAPREAEPTSPPQQDRNEVDDEFDDIFGPATTEPEASEPTPEVPPEPKSGPPVSDNVLSDDPADPMSPAIGQEIPDRGEAYDRARVTYLENLETMTSEQARELVVIAGRRGGVLPDGTTYQTEYIAALDDDLNPGEVVYTGTDGIAGQVSIPNRVMSRVRKGEGVEFHHNHPIDGANTGGAISPFSPADFMAGMRSLWAHSNDNRTSFSFDLAIDLGPNGKMSVDEWKAFVEQLCSFVQKSAAVRLSAINSGKTRSEQAHNYFTLTEAVPLALERAGYGYYTTNYVRSEAAIPYQEQSVEALVRQIERSAYGLVDRSTAPHGRSDAATRFLERIEGPAAGRDEGGPDGERAGSASGDTNDGSPNPETGATRELTDTEIEMVGRVMAREGYPARKGNQSYEDAVRAYAEDIIGRPIEPGSAAEASLQNAIEIAAVRRAQSIISRRDRDTDPDYRDTFQKLVDDYNAQPRIRTEVGNKRVLQQFSTPIPLGLIAQLAASADTAGSILEPTAGLGAMLTAVNPEASVQTVEMDIARANALEANLSRWHGNLSQLDMTVGDTLNTDYGTDASAETGGFEAVVANPPFGAQVIENTDTEFPMFGGRTTNQIDLAIAAKALMAMAPDGKATIVIGAPTPKLDAKSRENAYNKQAPHNRQAFFAALYRDYNVTSHKTVSGGLYSRQGANYPVDIIVVEGKAATPRKGIARPFETNGVPDVINSWSELWNAVLGETHGEMEVDTAGRTGDVGGGGGGRRAAGSDTGAVSPAAGTETGEADAGGGSGSERGGGAVRPGVRAEPGVRPPADGSRGAGGTGTGSAGVSEAGAGGANDQGVGATDDTGSADTGSSRGVRGVDTQKPNTTQKQPPGKTQSDIENLSPSAKAEPRDRTKSISRLRDLGKKLSGDETLKAPVYAAVPRSEHLQSQQIVDDPDYNAFVGDMRDVLLSLIEEGHPSAANIAAGDARNMVREIMLYLRDVENFTRAEAQGLLPFIKQFHADVQAGRIVLVDETSGSPRAEARNQSDGETEFEVPYKPKSQTAFDADTTTPKMMQGPAQDALQRIEDEVGDLDLYVADKLGYTPDEIKGKGQNGPFSRQQIDALAAAIFNHETNNTSMILGDQTGVGKGRVVAGMLRYARLNGMTPIFVTKNMDLLNAMVEDLRDIGELQYMNPLITHTGGEATGTSDGAKPAFKALSKKDYDAVFGVHKRGSTTNTPGSIAKTGELPSGYNALFTTYDQMNDAGSVPLVGLPDRRPRADAVQALAGNGRAFMVLDESHLSAGETTSEKTRGKEGGDSKGLAAFFRDTVSRLKGAMFSSATFSKRPETMFIYGMRTSMRHAVPNLNDLAGAISAGGVPMQQIITSMMAASGEYVRRQRSYKGVEFRTDEAKVDKDDISTLALALSELNGADIPLMEIREQFGQYIAAREGLVSMRPDGSIGMPGVSSASFASVMHNIATQATLAMKVDAIVANTIKRVKAGEKVIIGVDNTMGAAIDSYMDKNDINVGDSIAGADFKFTLYRYLDKMRTIKIKDPDGIEKPQEFYMDDAWMKANAPAELQAWNDAKKFVDGLSLSLPLSPIDAIMNGLREAGLDVDEITGRSRVIDSDGVIRNRPRSAGRNIAIMDRFNNNKDLNVLVLNRSGSTGISLHAGNNFKDPRPRHMIIAQPSPDIVDFMQLLGRIHRTNQKHLPSYSILVSDAPAERRIAARLSNKLRSLSANTSANDKSSVGVDTVDFMNKHGSRVAFEMLNEEPDLAARMNITPPGDQDGNYEPTDGSLINKLLNRSILLPYDVQNELVENLSARYLEEIASLNDVGLNDNEIAHKNLDAVAKGTPIVLTPDQGGGTPFDAPSKYEVLDVKRDIKPKTPAEIDADLRKSLGLPAGSTHADIVTAGQEAVAKVLSDAGTLVNETQSEAGDRVKTFEGEVAAAEARLADARHKYDVIVDGRGPTEMTAAAAKDPVLADQYATAIDALSRARRDIKSAVLNLEAARKAGDQSSTFMSSLNSILTTVGYVGAPLSTTHKVNQADEGATVPGIVVGVLPPPKGRNPLALGSYTLLLQTPDVSAPLRIPLSKIKSNRVFIVPADRELVDNQFHRAREGRETRAVVTGNLLAGFSKLGGKGQIISFNRRGSAEPEMGVLMPRNFDLEAFLQAQPVTFKTVEHIKEYFDGLDPFDKSSAAANVIKSLGSEAMLQRMKDGTYRLSIHNKAGGRIRRDVAFDRIVKQINPEGLVTPKSKSGRASSSSHVDVKTVEQARGMLQFLMDTHGLEFAMSDTSAKAKARGRQITEPGDVRYSAAVGKIPPMVRGSRRQAAEGAVHIISQMTGGTARVELVDQLFAGGEAARRSGILPATPDEQIEAAGSYEHNVDPLKALITISLSPEMNSPAMIPPTAAHEAWHWLRGQGLVSAKDLKVLERAAPKMRKRLAEIVGDESAALLDQEELEAYTITLYYRDELTPELAQVKGVLDVVREFFERFANWLAGAGYRSVDDILSDAISGQIYAQSVGNPGADWRSTSLRSPDPRFSQVLPTSSPQFTPQQNRAFASLMNRGRPVIASPADSTFFGRLKAVTESLFTMDLRNISIALQQNFDFFRNVNQAGFMSVMRQGVVDQFEAFRRLDMANPISEGDVAGGLNSVWKRAHIVTANTGAMIERMLVQGTPEWDETLQDFRVNRDGGFIDIIEPLREAGLLRHFELWLSGERAKRLKNETRTTKGGKVKPASRENFMSNEDIALTEELFRELTPAQQAMFRRAREQWMNYNRKFVTAIGKSGLLRTAKRGAYDEVDKPSDVERLLERQVEGMAEEMLYIPFHRLLDPDLVARSSATGALNLRTSGMNASQSGLKRLKGADMQIVDPTEMMIRNMHALVDRARRNSTGREAVKLGMAVGDGVIEPSRRAYKSLGDRKWLEANQPMLEDMGFDIDGIMAEAETGGSIMAVLRAMMDDAPPKSANEVSVMVDGKAVWYTVNDPMLLESLRGMDRMQRSWFERGFLGGAKSLLTRSVAMDPAFMVRNFVRDAQQAWILAPEKFVPIVGTFRGMKEVFGANQDQALDIGGAALYDYKRLDRLITDATGKTTKTKLASVRGMAQAYAEFGRKAELSNRQAVYDSVMDATADPHEALFQAMFLTNYGSRGNNSVMRWLVSTVPYLNARVQGLDRLLIQSGGFMSPSVRRKALAKQLFIRGALFATTTIAIESFLWGDDDYEQLEDWEKDAYLHFRGPGGDLYRIPKGFEIGLAFGTVPTRITRWLRGDDSGKELAGAMARGASETLSLNPIPQAFKPMLEVAMNRSMFTGREIESQGMERLSPGMRYRDTTSDALVSIHPVYNGPARMLGAMMGVDMALSPVQMESLVRGYTGPMGMYVLAAADTMSAAITGEEPIKDTLLGVPKSVWAPPQRAIDNIARSFHVADVPRNTKFTTDFYRYKERADTAYADMRAALKLGDNELAQEIIDENRLLLNRRVYLGRIGRQMSEIRNAIKLVRGSKTMDDDAKDRQIEHLQSILNQLSERGVSSVAAE